MAKATVPRRGAIDEDAVDKLRHEFAERVRSLIGDVKDERKLEHFSAKTGIGIRQLSEWQNKRRYNWPSVKNLIKIALVSDVSIDWLLLGKKERDRGKRHGSKLRATLVGALAALTLWCSSASAQYRYYGSPQLRYQYEVDAENRRLETERQLEIQRREIERLRQQQQEQEDRMREMERRRRLCQVAPDICPRFYFWP